MNRTQSNNKRKTRVMICEDHLIARVGLNAIVNAQPDMTVVGEAIHGEQAVALYRECRPDVTLMDIRMPVMNGFDSISGIRREFPDARVVALSTFGGDEDIRRALQAGALAFLTKDAPQDDLIAAIRTVSAGNPYFTAQVRATLEQENRGPDLSSRELDVLRLLAQGMTNKQIAFELKIAEDTAKNHVKSILKKLGAQDRTQAATDAIQRGIIHLEW